MANYHIGLDFGTSQTKVCLLNTDNDEREFIEFDNASFFLPTIITRKKDGTFSYGKEDENGTVYRYFKMAAAEDEELIQATNEDLTGKLLSPTELDSFRKYNENYDIKPEILSILYLTYVLLYVKDNKQETSENGKEKTGALARFSTKKTEDSNTFSVKMGIPTEWHNPDHIKRKIKFETILIVVHEFSESFSNLADFLKENTEKLLGKANEINKKHSKRIDALTKNEKKVFFHSLLHQHKLSVFPETAAGITFLLANKRLANGYFAAMDIGAGTSDISIFLVRENKIVTYLCSESVEIASNNVYSEYAGLNGVENNYASIRQIEILYKSGKSDPHLFQDSLRSVKKKLELAIRKIFYRKHWKPLDIADTHAAGLIRQILDFQFIIIYGGGANFAEIKFGDYMFFQNNPEKPDTNNYFIVRPISHYIDQVEVKNYDKVKEHINLLILALGLSYLPKDESNHDFFTLNDLPSPPDNYDNTNNEKYFYYDIQDAVYK